MGLLIFDEFLFLIAPALQKQSWGFVDLRRLL